MRPEFSQRKFKWVGYQRLDLSILSPILSVICTCHHQPQLQLPVSLSTTPRKATSLPVDTGVLENKICLFWGNIQNGVKNLLRLHCVTQQWTRGVSAPAAETGELRQQTFVSHSLEFGNRRSGCGLIWFLARSLPGLQMLLLAHTAFPERVSQALWCVFRRGHCSHRAAPTLMTLSNWSYLPMAADTITCGFGAAA